jgi:hypothetical protein
VPTPAPATTYRSFGAGNPGDEKKRPTIFLSSNNYPHDPEAVQKKLKWVHDRLQEAELEGYGKQRGKQPILKLLRAEAPSNRKQKNVNLSVAQTEIKSLIYLRHALRQGALRFKDLDPKAMAKSFLGEDTKQKIPQLDGRRIIFEQWRWGKSQLLDNKYMKAHLEQQENKRLTLERQAQKAQERENRESE